ncbi:MAG: hypothetical protein JWM66_425 [Solirubrobacterales bacterium]|jgi:hypothetical protein|nr:hypothetical protein [Solirubrobacterales bacterium]
MAEIAIPLDAVPRWVERGALRTLLRALAPSRRTPEPATARCCFGRMGAKDAMIARGLAAQLADRRGECR